MALYRALRDLDNGIRKGELFGGHRLSQRAIPILVEKGIIAEVAAPPLRELPVWNDRAPLLDGKAETLADVVELDPEEFRNPGEVAEWQKQAKELLQYPAPDGWYLKNPLEPGCGGCKKPVTTEAVAQQKRRRARKPAEATV